MSHFNPIFYFVAPEDLKLPSEYKTFLKKNNIPFSEHSEINDVINDVDILYMTRVQKERFSDPIEYERVKNVYVLRNEMLENTKPNLKILHPLPRVNEIHTNVDGNTKAYYFQQAKNGVYARMAIMAAILGLK